MIHIQKQNSKTYGEYYEIDGIKILKANWEFHKKTKMFNEMQIKAFENYIKNE